MKRLITIALLWPLWAGATTYTVGTGGDFATVADITWGSINAGDVIDGQGETFEEQMDIGASGSSGNPIVIQNFVLDGTDTLGSVLTFYDSSPAEYIAVKDVTLKNATGHGLNFSPTVTDATMAGIRLERVVSMDHGDNCFKLGDPTGGGGMPGLVAIDIEARRCGNVGISVSGQSNPYFLRPIVHTAGQDGGNLDGIAIDDGADGAQVWFPKIYNQRAGQAIDFQDSTGSARNLLVGPYIEAATDLTTIDSISLTGSSPTTVVSAIIKGGRDGILVKSTVAHRVYNAVVDTPTQYCWRAGISASNGVLDIANSVCIEPGGKVAWVRDDAGSSITTDYNFAITDSGSPYTYKGTSYSLTDWRTQTSDAANSAVYPVGTRFFVKSDPSNPQDYKPIVGGTLLGAGEFNGSFQDHGNRRFKFPTPVGAWEAASGDAAEARTAR